LIASLIIGPATIFLPTGQWQTPKPTVQLLSVVGVQRYGNRELGM